MKKAVKESPVIEEEWPEVFINSEDTMTMDNIDQFKGHRGGALHGIEIAAGGAETAVTTEGDKFEVSAVWAAVHGTAKSRVAAVGHLFHVLNNRSTRMQYIDYFFVMVFKNIL